MVFVMWCYKPLAPLGHMGNLYLEMLEAVAPPGHSQLFLLWRYKPLAPLGHMGNLYLEMLEAVAPPGHHGCFFVRVTNLLPRWGMDYMGVYFL
jgi:hypothetical protein